MWPFKKKCKLYFDLNKKVNGIKGCRIVSGLGLKESKALIDEACNVGKNFIEVIGVSKKEANARLKDYEVYKRGEIYAK